MTAIKAIYHPSSDYYPLCKRLGFNTVEVGVGAWPGSIGLLDDAINTAHSIGLDCLIDLGLEKHHKDSIQWIKTSKAINYDDIIMLYDEPNLKNIRPAVVKYAREYVRVYLPYNRTLISLSPIRGFFGYENLVDIVGFSWYKRWSGDPWGLIKLIVKIKLFKRNHSGQAVAIPGIRYSPDYVKKQKLFWDNIIGVDGYAWYSFTPSEEKPPWFNEDLNNLSAMQAALLKVNE